MHQIRSLPFLLDNSVVFEVTWMPDSAAHAVKAEWVNPRFDGDCLVFLD